MNEYIYKLKEFIELSENQIPKKGMKELKYYCNHAEYEMAFEGLIIELISANKYPQKFDATEWKKVAIAFGLKEESVFDSEIWNKFMNWCALYNNK